MKAAKMYFCISCNTQLCLCESCLLICSCICLPSVLVPLRDQGEEPPRRWFCSTHKKKCSRDLVWGGLHIQSPINLPPEVNAVSVFLLHISVSQAVVSQIAPSEVTLSPPACSEKQLWLILRPTNQFAPHVIALCSQYGFFFFNTLSPYFFTIQNVMWKHGILTRSHAKIKV